MKWICEGKGWSGGYVLEGVTGSEQEFKQNLLGNYRTIYTI